MISRLKDIKTITLTEKEIDEIIKIHPFEEKDEKPYITILFEETKESMPKETKNKDLKIIKASKKVVFSLAYEVNGKNGNPNAFLEKSLKVDATTRNLNTIKKIKELLSN